MAARLPRCGEPPTDFFVQAGWALLRAMKVRECAAVVTAALNGIIELHRRLGRGDRNRQNYRLRMLLVADSLTGDPPPDV
ncbi:hypothetical protein FBY39_1947 [Microbacterium sp. SLBN-146]|nr:hypothetical protein FBY39_1947 [Microbacterium sp. SLBN-146]